jgi:hypothetical protein
VNEVGPITRVLAIVGIVALACYVGQWLGWL